MCVSMMLMMMMMMMMMMMNKNECESKMRLRMKEAKKCGHDGDRFEIDRFRVSTSRVQLVSMMCDERTLNFNIIINIANFIAHTHTQSIAFIYTSANH